MRLLREMRGILVAEGGRNWLPGIDAAISALEQPPARDIHPDEGLRQAASIYRTMNRGPGSFGDFYVQRADPAEQARANERFSEVADELWFLLDAIR